MPAGVFYSDFMLIIYNFSMWILFTVVIKG